MFRGLYICMPKVQINHKQLSGLYYLGNNADFYIKY